MTVSWDTPELIYLAGYLDGEGCFIIKGVRSGTPMITTENTHKPTIEWIHATFGGRVEHLIRKEKPQWRPTYRWSVLGAAAIELCNQLLPVLKEKQPQAELLIELWSGPKFQGRRDGVPKFELQRRKELQMKISALKRVRYD